MTKTMREILETREEPEQNTTKLTTYDDDFERMTPEERQRLTFTEMWYPTNCFQLDVTDSKVNILDLVNLTMLDQIIISGCKGIAFKDGYIPKTVSYIRANDDSCKHFKIDQVDNLTHLFLDNNHGVKIEGQFPAKMSAFSAKGVKFEDILDFRRCDVIAFLVYKEAGLQLGKATQLDYVKVGNTEAARGEEAAEMKRQFQSAEDQSAEWLIEHNKKLLAEEMKKIERKNG